MIEHAPNLSVRFICDRGVTHELVRHRIFSFAHESTRYVNYNKKGIQFIIPEWVCGKDRKYMLSSDLDPSDDLEIHVIKQYNMYFTSSCIDAEVAYP